ncbi:MAG: amino acid ABC transporter ATP-binding protein [Propionibacteriaceae bacterium]|nr:amino acid ABC transporter ATP-binding protein [Propionibacteriaceae bacterium]
MTTQPMVRIHDLKKAFGHHVVLEGVDMEVSRGEVVFVIGPSGSGKSTLLRCINGLEPYDGGEIWVGDYLVGAELHGDRWVEASPKVAAQRRSRIGMVFQRFDLFPNMTALENITAGLRLVHHQSPKEAEARGRELLERVGLSERADSYPGQLSGGQQQRIAIARAIAAKPNLVLFDEPTSALDPELVGEVLDVIRDLAESGMSLIVVTHEIHFALDVADVVYFVDGGRVVESGSPESVIKNPRHERTISFLQRINRESL